MSEVLCNVLNSKKSGKQAILLASSITTNGTLNLKTLLPSYYNEISIDNIILNPLASATASADTNTNISFQGQFRISKSISNYILTTSMYANLYWVGEGVSHIANISYSVYALVN